MLPSLQKIRKYFVVAWLVLMGIVLYLYFFRSDFFHNQLEQALRVSLLLGYAIYFVVGCLRGLALIPVTSLIVLGLLFFPPLPLFIMTLAGILISSASLYYFSEFLGLDVFFEYTYRMRFEQVRAMLQKHELPVIIAWSFFPLLPTDLICYACGILRVNFPKFLLGVLIGEGVCSGLYIWGGQYLLRALSL